MDKEYIKFHMRDGSTVVHPKEEVHRIESHTKYYLKTWYEIDSGGRLDSEDISYIETLTEEEYKDLTKNATEIII